MVSALLLLLMMGAVHAYAAPEHKTFSLIAFGLMVCAMSLTGTVHFVELTALRQLGTAGIAWPSVPYAVELLAWNLLLGLSLLFASRVFERDGRAVRVRHSLTVCGALCLGGTIGPAVGDMRLQFIGGTIGPAVGDMRLQFIGVFGYAVALPAAMNITAIQYVEAAALRN